MKILAIDTSSTACSVALLLEDEIKAIDRLLPLQQAQSILPQINELLTQCKIELKQLDALAFGRGPGSFTGVRIATSVIQGLGFALNLPIIPISSLAAVAQAAFKELGWKKLLVSVDARIQEVYWGAYSVNAEGLVTLVGNEVVSKPSELVFPEDKEWYGVGDAWEVYRNQIKFDPLAIDSTRFPMASGVLQLAIPYYLRQEWVSAADALPVYLRDNVAKIGK
jgi:tRNA threonylcarbamoyladenosine biosynthesis protein TsaB